MKKIVFYKLQARIEDDDDDKVKVPFYTPFLEQKKDIDCSLHFIVLKGPFELVHADVANIRFFQSLQLIQVIVYYVLIAFSSKFYVYPMKKGTFQQKSLQFFIKKLNQNVIWTKR